MEGSLFCFYDWQEVGDIQVYRSFFLGIDYLFVYFYIVGLAGRYYFIFYKLGLLLFDGCY